jgi:hypothetical protein
MPSFIILKDYITAMTPTGRIRGHPPQIWHRIALVNLKYVLA